MANKIQQRRGLKANMPTLSAGEIGYATDTRETFIGTGSGNVNMGGSHWYRGMAMSGTVTTTGYYSFSACPQVKVDDMYLNTSNGNVYACTTAGSRTSAKWTYQGSIKGATGATGAKGDAGFLAEPDIEQLSAYSINNVDHIMEMSNPISSGVYFMSGMGWIEGDDLEYFNCIQDSAGKTYTCTSYIYNNCSYLLRLTSDSKIKILHKDETRKKTLTDMAFEWTVNEIIKTL